MGIKNILKKTIEQIWKNEIKHDYENNFIINEDTLKISFCYHLRTKLTDSYLLENNIRIITELKIKKLEQKVDIAIVKVDEEREKMFHFTEFIEDVLALIELKFIPIKLNKLNQMLLAEDLKRFDKDLFKLKEYGKIYDKCLLVGAFIHEYFYRDKIGMFCLHNISHFLRKKY
jgi:hypothetical protein